LSRDLLYYIVDLVMSLCSRAIVSRMCDWFQICELFISGAQREVVLWPRYILYWQIYSKV